MQSVHISQNCLKRDLEINTDVIYSSTPGLQSAIDNIPGPPPHFAIEVNPVQELRPGQLHRLHKGRVEVWVWVLPCWGQMTNSGGEIGADVVAGLPVVCRDTIVYGVDLFDEVLVHLVEDLLHQLVVRLDAQHGGNDLPPKVAIDETGARELCHPFLLAVQTTKSLCEGLLVVVISVFLPVELPSNINDQGAGVQDCRIPGQDDYENAIKVKVFTLFAQLLHWHTGGGV